VRNLRYTKTKLPVERQTFSWRAPRGDQLAGGAKSGGSAISGTNPSMGGTGVLWIRWRERLPAYSIG
jgi:hypothetical protein